MKEAVACAVYTRKSSEDGLEQGFNSLDAQREACEAYILSQKAQGWLAVPGSYDDGGFSGGNTERPGLKRLLADVALGRVRIVVVYKVDRLTRSLADFAKLVELFDAHGVSFVSVTQQFNTTSSMGRLTLNVLLSFAQFEREVTGERIRDKIAASKRKGLWMGGMVPVGYAPHERTLVIDAPQAERIRSVFALYLELGCVRQLTREVARLGWLTPVRASRRQGQQGGRPFSRGHLYRILKNPIYIGRIAHKDQVFDGQHPAIIETDVWDMVQGRIKANLQGHRTRVNAANPSVLAGLVFDGQKNPLIPSHAKKGERRYRYYVSSDLHTQGREAAPNALRVPAKELENAALYGLTEFLQDEHRLMDLMASSGVTDAYRVRRQLQQALDLSGVLQNSNTSGRIAILHRVIRKIWVHQDKIQMEIRTVALLDPDKSSVPEASEATEESVELIEVPIELKRVGMAVRMIVHGPGRPSGRVDPKLLAMVSKAHDWFERLSSGRSKNVTEIATAQQVSNAYVIRVLHLAFLAPDIVQRFQDGNYPTTLNCDRLTRMAPFPLDWAAQRKLLGMTG